MIYCVVSVTVKTGKLDEYLKLFKANAENVRKEKGCVEYFPAVDMDGGLPFQSIDKNVVTIIERWETMEDLHRHIKTPEMAAHFQKEKPLVEKAVGKVLMQA